MVCTKTFRRKNLPIILSIQLLNKSVDVGLIWAGVILLAMYVAIIFEVAHRTVVTMIASTAAIPTLVGTKAGRGFKAVDDVDVWFQKA